MKKYLLSLSFLALSGVAMAQSGTNSPYSQYGLGVMSDQSQGFSRGMNGVGLAFREHNRVNSLNPASYSAIDSVTFIFDVGMSLQLTNFSENGKRKNAKNADFEYAVAAFRVMKHLGMSAGIIPYSNIGYSFTKVSDPIDGFNIAPSTESTTYSTSTYTGSGGIHQVHVGLGWEPLKSFSVGAHIYYVWGDIARYATSTFSDGYVKTSARNYTTNVSNVRFDFGAMYTQKIGKGRELTLGAVYAPKKNLHADGSCKTVTTNTQTAVSDYTEYIAYDCFSTPEEIGIGLSYSSKNQWKVGFDYTRQNWSAIDYPTYGKKDGKDGYYMTQGMFKDRQKFNVGGEYCRNEYGRSFADRMRYRFGVSYATPYLMINGKEGPKEYSVSAGVGIPIINTYNNRSMLNLSVQYARNEAKGLINENTFRINVGLTFNERWFAKWKFE